jgi:hypothetical protein
MTLTAAMTLAHWIFADALRRFTRLARITAFLICQGGLAENFAMYRPSTSQFFPWEGA